MNTEIIPRLPLPVPPFRAEEAYPIRRWSTLYGYIIFTPNRGVRFYPQADLIPVDVMEIVTKEMKRLNRLKRPELNRVIRERRKKGNAN